MAWNCLGREKRRLRQRAIVSGTPTSTSLRSCQVSNTHGFEADGGDGQHAARPPDAVRIVRKQPTRRPITRTSHYIPGALWLLRWQTHTLRILLGLFDYGFLLRREVLGGHVRITLSHRRLK
jgi:hypothetical protein